MIYINCIFVVYISIIIICESLVSLCYWSNYIRRAICTGCWKNLKNFIRTRIANTYIEAPTTRFTTRICLVCPLRYINCIFVVYIPVIISYVSRVCLGYWSNCIITDICTSCIVIPIIFFIAIIYLIYFLIYINCIFVVYIPVIISYVSRVCLGYWSNCIITDICTSCSIIPIPRFIATICLVCPLRYINCIFVVYIPVIISYVSRVCLGYWSNCIITDICTSCIVIPIPRFIATICLVYLLQDSTNELDCVVEDIDSAADATEWTEFPNCGSIVIKRLAKTITVVILI